MGIDERYGKKNPIHLKAFPQIATLAGEKPSPAQNGKEAAPRLVQATISGMVVIGIKGKVS